MKRNKNKKGFTIVELVIVIGVIGILSAILIPTFVSLTDRANEAKLKSNLANAYSMYAAQAADGVFEDDNGNPVVGVSIEFLEQSKVVLKEKAGSNYYVYSNNEWDKNPYSGTAPTKTVVRTVAETPANDEAKSTFGDYIVFVKVLA